jgi:hypothetical protein
MKMKGARILKNVKTSWIFMLSFVWHIMVEDKTLLMKMAINNPTSNKAKMNFDFFLNVHILLVLL